MVKEIFNREELLQGIVNAIGIHALQEVFEQFRHKLETLTPDERDPPGRLFVRDVVLVCVHRMVSGDSFNKIERTFKIPHSSADRMWKWFIKKVRELIFSSFLN